MPAKTPRLALDAYLGRVRRTVQCIAQTEVIASRARGEALQSIALVPHGAVANAPAPLRGMDGNTNLLLRMRQRYSVSRLSGMSSSGVYRVVLAYYAYTILDRDERELLAYHWHPEGVSDVTAPHLHIPRVAPIPLPRVDPARAVALGEMHLPTNRVLLEDVVELLIREFAIVPLLPDWQAALAASRSELDQER